MVLIESVRLVRAVVVRKRCMNLTCYSSLDSGRWKLLEPSAIIVLVDADAIATSSASTEVVLNDYERIYE